MVQEYRGAARRAVVATRARPSESCELHLPVTSRLYARPRGASTLWARRFLMRYALLGLTLLATAADRTSDRDALLAVDRSLSDKTAAAGLTRGFFPVLTDDAIYLYPGAPLLRGSSQIRSFLSSSDS